MPDLVQIRNPRTDRYVKIDRAVGRILGEKRTKGPWKNVPIGRKRKEEESDKVPEKRYNMDVG